MNHYRIKTTKGVFIYLKRFWMIHASGNIVNLMPRKTACVGNQTEYDVCKQEQKRLKIKFIKSALNERGAKPALLIFNAKLLELPVTDEGLTVAARMRQSV